MCVQHAQIIPTPGSSCVAGSWGMMAECIISEEWMDGAWCQKVVLGVSLEIPAMFGVCTPDYMS